MLAYNITYMDIMTGENCQIRLLTWNSFTGQFVYPVRGEEMRGIVSLARCEYLFTKVHENRLQLPSDNISII